MKSLFLSVVVSAMACAGVAKTCTWKGGSGDWNVAGNWEEGTVPEDGDTVVLTAGAAAATINNGLMGLSLARIEFTGDQQITLTGNGYRLDGTGDVWANACTVAQSAPLRIVQGCNLTGTASVTFSGEVAIDEATVLFNFSGQKVTFNEVVNAPLATINGTGDIEFNKKVAAYKIQSGTNNGMNVVFKVAGNDVKFVTAGVYGKINLKAANIFEADNVFTYYVRTGGNQWQGWINLEGDQSIDRVESQKGGSDTQQGLQGWGKITQNATADATTYCWLNGQVSLIWNPLGNYTQTLCHKDNATTGFLTVKRGTLKVAEQANYTKLKSVNVDGGAFVVDSSAEVVFAALETLAMEEGTTFEVTGNAGATPFGSSSVNGKMGYGAKLKIAADKTLSFARLEVVGTLPAAGTYTGSGYGTDGVTEVPWIEGAGRVTVSNAGIAHTAWKAAVSGNWNDADNWTAGVPTADVEAFVSAKGADYTVTVDGTPTMPKRLVVANDDSHTATLSVEASVSFTAAYLELMSGGKITVPTGGNLLYNGHKGDGSRMMNSGAGYPVRVNAGGTLEVAGGAVTLTNVCGDVLLCGSESKTGTVSVVSGRFYYGCDFNQEWSNADFFILNPNGAFLQSGGMALFEHSKGGSTTVLQNRGGRISVTGGTFGPVTERGGHKYASYFNFGGGENVFSGSAVYRTEHFFRLEPLTADGEMQLTFKDQARLQYADGNVADQLAIGKRGRTSLGIYTDVCGTANFATGAFVGYNGGETELTIGENGRFAIGGRGLMIGCDDTPTSSSAGVTGVVNVLGGGCLYVTGYATDGYSKSYLQGLSVGYGACTSVRDGRPYDGTLNVCGGAVTNGVGDFVVGVGYATGRMLLDGGFVLASTGKDESNVKAFGVGLGGGVGACTVSNGTLRVPCNAYVGGANTNVFYSSLKLAAAGWPVNSHDAQGTLTVAGGAVEFGRSLVLGADGRGTLEVIGAAGAVSVAGDLVLSNAVENAASGATLSFALDPVRGVSPVVVTGKVTGGTGSKLVVDLGAYKGRSFWLIKAGAVEGDFEKVEVTGDVAKNVVVVKEAAGWKAKMPNGLLLIVR